MSAIQSGPEEALESFRVFQQLRMHDGRPKDFWDLFLAFLVDLVGARWGAVLVDGGRSGEWKAIAYCNPDAGVERGAAIPKCFAALSDQVFQPGMKELD